jgi:hypothetical protein
MRFTRKREAEVLAALSAKPDAHVVFPASAYRPDGSILISRDGTRTFLHRHLYTLVVGPIPPKHYLLAGCDKDRCQNPHHRKVIASTHVPKGRAPRSRATGEGMSAPQIQRSKTHCPQDHEYTPENTYVWTDASGTEHRKCKTCTIARNNRVRRTARLTKAETR